MCNQNQWCRAQAELDGIQEDQTRMAELGIAVPPLQSAEQERRKEKVAKLVKVSVFHDRELLGCVCLCLPCALVYTSELLSFEDIVLKQLMYTACVEQRQAVCLVWTMCCSAAVL